MVSSFLIIFMASLIGSALTLFSGFGLGTLMLPVFSIFFPLPLAIAMTAIVHLLNNFLKLGLFIRHTHWKTVALFGITSVIGALLGAYLLSIIDKSDIQFTYSLFGFHPKTNPVKLIIGSLMITFAIYELWPGDGVVFKGNHLLTGGLVSGFFGGLSGHQGALRSAFLIHLNFSKETFIATGVTIACFVDLTRIPLYFINSDAVLSLVNPVYIVIAVLGAFIGVYLGSKYLKKVTIHSVQVIVGSLLLIYGILLTSGII